MILIVEYFLRIYDELILQIPICFRCLRYQNSYNVRFMTWLWEKVRNSLRNGRLRIRLRKLLDVQNSDHLAQSSEDVSRTRTHFWNYRSLNKMHNLFSHLRPSQDEVLDIECDDEDSTSYFGICSACKLAINHYRHFNLSALDFLSARSNTCPFCGLRYRGSGERCAATASAGHDENENIDEIPIRERSREQRSGSEPTVPSYRLPPIVSAEK